MGTQQSPTSCLQTAETIVSYRRTTFLRDLPPIIHVAFVGKNHLLNVCRRMLKNSYQVLNNTSCIKLYLFITNVVHTVHNQLFPNIKHMAKSPEKKTIQTHKHKNTTCFKKL